MSSMSYRLLPVPGSFLACSKRLIVKYLWPNDDFWKCRLALVHCLAVPLYTNRLNVKDIHFWDSMCKPSGLLSITNLNNK